MKYIVIYWRDCLPTHDQNNCWETKALSGEYRWTAINYLNFDIEYFVTHDGANDATKVCQTTKLA